MMKPCSKCNRTRHLIWSVPPPPLPPGWVMDLDPANCGKRTMQHVAFEHSMGRWILVTPTVGDRGRKQASPLGPGATVCPGKLLASAWPAVEASC